MASSKNSFRNQNNAQCGAGAILEAVDGDGRTPLHWAAREGHTEVVRMLLSAGDRMLLIFLCIWYWLSREKASQRKCASGNIVFWGRKSWTLFCVSIFGILNSLILSSSKILGVKLSKTFLNMDLSTRDNDLPIDQNWGNPTRNGWHSEPPWCGGYATWCRWESPFWCETTCYIQL